MPGCPDARVIEGMEDLKTLPVMPKYGVVSQTTQLIERVRCLVSAMEEQFRESEFCFRETLCQPTKNRQRALGELLGKCELIVVVGGQNSNNPRVLVKTARRAGVDSFLISKAGELSREKVRGRERIGGDDWDVAPERLCRKSGSGYGAAWWKMPKIG